MKKIIFTLFVSLLVSSVYAQEKISQVSGELTQRDPKIARSQDGKYMIAWFDENGDNGEVRYQKFNADGSADGEALLPYAAMEGKQEKPALAMNASGTAVLAWASNRFNSESIYDIEAVIPGLTTGPVIVNATTEHSQTKPSVDINGAGDIVIAWESWYQDGSHKGVYAQKFDSNLYKIGDEFQVNTTTNLSQGRPVVKYLEDNKFVILWESWRQDMPNGYGLYAKIYNNDGSVFKDEFLVNAYNDDDQWFADVDALPGGGFAAVWCSWMQDGYDGGIYLQLFDAEGEKNGPEIRVNKTAKFYQWLPKVKVLSNGNIVVVWSSWQQDGSREGVYARIYDPSLRAVSFETVINDHTEGYQWEPSLIPGNEENEIIVVYSDWIDNTNKYDLTVKKATPKGSQGSVKPRTYGHTSGTSTTSIYVHVMDEQALTGHEYEVTFSDIDEESAFVDITDKTTNELKIDNFHLAKGEGIFYITPVFDGVAVEIVPEFDFDLDYDGSYFVNNSGSNMGFSVAKPAGNTFIAPVDAAIVFGSTATNADGSYVTPLDSAYNIQGQRVVELPFYAENLTDGGRFQIYVKEVDANSKWDPNENIVLMTPPQYSSAFPIFHAQVLSSVPAGGDVLLPTEGDSVYIFTDRPLKEEDVFTFTTIPENLTDVEENGLNPVKFALEQNYPNPFNPYTTILYSIPESGMVNLSVYNILGEKVTDLVNMEQPAGNYRAGFNGDRFASGVYLYRLEYNGKNIVKKMALVK